MTSFIKEIYKGLLENSYNASAKQLRRQNLELFFGISLSLFYTNSGRSRDNANDRTPNKKHEKSMNIGTLSPNFHGYPLTNHSYTMKIDDTNTNIHGKTCKEKISKEKSTLPLK